jgi:hypothetical protein
MTKQEKREEVYASIAFVLAIIVVLSIGAII